MFPILFLCFLLFLLLVDFVFLPRSVRRAWLMMVLTFSVAATMVLFTDGHATTGGSLTVGAANAANNNIVVHTVTFGSAANQSAK